MERAGVRRAKVERLDRPIARKLAPPDRPESIDPAMAGQSTPLGRVPVEPASLQASRSNAPSQHRARRRGGRGPTICRGVRSRQEPARRATRRGGGPLHRVGDPHGAPPEDGRAPDREPAVLDPPRARDALLDRAHEGRAPGDHRASGGSPRTSTSPPATGRGSRAPRRLRRGSCAGAGSGSACARARRTALGGEVGERRPRLAARRSANACSTCPGIGPQLITRGGAPER